MNICISAETTVDLTPELLKEYDIHTIPFGLTMGEEAGLDGQIKPEDLFEYTKKTGQLPRTSAVNEFQYEEYFRALLKEYDHVIHFSLSSELSSACQNAVNVSNEDEFKGKVDIIDSRSLSTGIALHCLYARKLARVGKEPKAIVDAVKARLPYGQASFSLESVNYLYKGGRCSMLQMLGANVLGLKPEIFVKDGKMVSGAKYRGPMKKVVMEYVEDTLKLFPNADKEEVFITYSTAPEEVLATVQARLEKEGFKHIHQTRAGATISCHCGPHCLGILYINDGPHPIA
ncbi:MAG: DegV family protein [Bacilli bacterium]|nr:DegV family protein [Bacilli bacterium]